MQGPLSGNPPAPVGWNWDHSYTRLPEIFFTPTLPTRVPAPGLAILNRPLAGALGLDAGALEKAADIFAGNEIPPGSEPIAQAYAGHQFGNFTNLGDGRAILLGEHLAPSGIRSDIQLKGPGRTRYSRGGDGRATLGPMLREYIISEAMHALGIPTTRSLAVATTGEEIFRNEFLPGAVLTRVAASHIRVGTFQYAAAHEDLPALTALADHTLKRHFPELAGSGTRYFDFFEAVMDRQASLIARWLCVGFIHGVMNTDNMALSGETIDYGPCAFMDDYDPETVFSSIDRYGRYAYDKQPQIARWNLARLAETLLPLFHEDQNIAIDLANDALGSFEARFQAYWLLGMRSKLGLFTAEKEDAALVQELLDWMHANHQDFTNTFRSLSSASSIAEPPFIDAAFLAWHEKWTARLGRQPATTAEVVEKMRAHNPVVIPRNHKVEQALDTAIKGDLTVTHRLLEILTNPYADSAPPEYTTPPPQGGAAYQTFCGT
ncbi:YdiU family protein [Luteolibacter yonseiensis]|uniref:Protein nucleotidyltransferase YdiU n=1 Tax=Luteolibacter yonseiensis TaxID=1144680 RepID=A0A934VAD2_9BACT|nr:YdiU family protein [Luteolibacter yonseiensis]MBK1815030.1 YdiU family protein [Luteolibacter yonseiensis]